MQFYQKQGAPTSFALVVSMCNNPYGLDTIFMKTQRPMRHVYFRVLNFQDLKYKNDLEMQQISNLQVDTNII